jgi:hypothetical protein
LVDEAEATVRMGTRQLCCLLNADAASFARAAENLRPSGGEPSPHDRHCSFAGVVASDGGAGRKAGARSDPHSRKFGQTPTMSIAIFLLPF